MAEVRIEEARREAARAAEETARETGAPAATAAVAVVHDGDGTVHNEVLGAVSLGAPPPASVVEVSAESAPEGPTRSEVRATAGVGAATQRAAAEAGLADALEMRTVVGPAEEAEPQRHWDGPGPEPASAVTTLEAGQEARDFTRDLREAVRDAAAAALAAGIAGGGAPSLSLIHI